MSFYVEVFLKRLGPHAFNIVASFNGVPFAKIEAEMDVVDLTSPATIPFPSLPIAIDKEGYVELHIERDGHKNQAILKRRLRPGKVG